MPIYEYRCQSCEREFELLRPMAQANDHALCLQCKGRAVRRVSVFAPVVRSGGSLMDMPLEGMDGGACGCGGACNCGAWLN